MKKGGKKSCKLLSRIETLREKLEGDKPTTRTFNQQCEKLAKEIRSEDSGLPKNQKQRNDCFENFKLLIKDIQKKFANNDVCDLVFELYKTQFHLTKQFYSGSNKRDEIIKLAAQLVESTKPVIEMKKDNHCPKIIEFLEELKEEILMSVEPDTNDYREKSRQFAWFSLYHGESLSKMKRYSKSIEIYTEAIDFMKLIYAKEAEMYRVVLFCYRNIATTFLAQNHKSASKTYISRAKGAVDEVIDWDELVPDEKDKFIEELEKLNVVASTRKNKVSSK